MWLRFGRAQARKELMTELQQARDDAMRAQRELTELRAVSAKQIESVQAAAREAVASAVPVQRAAAQAAVTDAVAAERARMERLKAIEVQAAIERVRANSEAELRQVCLPIYACLHTHIPIHILQMLAYACLRLPMLAYACLRLPLLAYACLRLPALACACLRLPALACAGLCWPMLVPVYRCACVLAVHPLWLASSTCVYSHGALSARAPTGRLDCHGEGERGGGG